MPLNPSPFFDAAPCYLTVVGRDFSILHANQRFRDDFGDPDGRFCYQIYKGRAEKCETCPVERAFWDGHNHRNEGTVRRRDGTEVTVLSEATPMYDPDGATTAVINMATDITQIKNLQRQLRRSQQRYHLLFDEVPCYISIQDPELNIIEANRAFQDGFGTSLGRKCYDAYKHRKEPCTLCPVQETFEDGKLHTREEVVTSLSGKPMNVLVTTAPIRDGHGRITGVMEMSADITQVRELEDRLTSLGLLVGSVSHGLKGMLNGLAGGMYLVNTGFKNKNQERVDKGWETVQRNVARIRSMVSDILYYAKDRVPNWEPLSAAEVGEEVFGLMESRAEELNIQLTKVLDTTTGTFEGDAQAVRSLLVNLVENSLDACRLDLHKSEHAVNMQIQGTPSHVRFEVKDSGIGMDRETCDRAFTLFFSSKGTGTGLGLFIADRIARAHGGTIEIESEPGVGTVFTVTLPRKRPIEPEAAASYPLLTEAFDD